MSVNFRPINKATIIELKINVQLWDMPRKRSDLLLNISTMVKRTTDKITRIVATAKMVGLICSLIPENICLGKVRCRTSASCKTTTTSSNEVINANSAPDITPGKIKGVWTLKKVRIGPAPKLADALVKLLSNPTKVAVTVIITNGVPKTA